MSCLTVRLARSLGSLHPSFCLSSRTVDARIPTSIVLKNLQHTPGNILHLHPLFFSHSLIQGSSNVSRTFYTSVQRYKDDDVKPQVDEKAKQSTVAKFKQMFRDYWYVLVPVHLATSAIWFGSFYVLVKSGIDVASILSSLGVSEAYLSKIAHSEWSYVALAYACYKIATPARYTITVGGTTFAVKYLTNLGYLRTSKEVAQDFRDRMDIVEDKVKVKWEKYNESRRRRKKRKRKPQLTKSKKE